MSTNCITNTSKSCFKPCCANSLRGPDPTSSPKSNLRRDFVTAMLSTIEPNTSFTNHESLPSLNQLYSTFINAFPQYLTTVLADDIRAREYPNLSNSNHVCLDYIGNGLFSHSQLQNCNQKDEDVSAEIVSSSSSSSMYSPFFNISYKSVDLNSYISPDSEESEFETTMRKRIIKYMNLFEEDYHLVFTANQTSALKLVADSYPFKSNQNILTVYDHDDESIQAMIETAKAKGATTLSASFTWPSLRINYKKLHKVLVHKNKQKNRGLFVFPLQSRMTGTRYSHQWMNLARDNGWHVLLDASALGAKDMETLGLSLFQPDFILSSFYKIFGENPSGLCCLFIKKSTFPHLKTSNKTIGTIISLIQEKGSIPITKPIQETPTTSKSHYTAEITQTDENYTKSQSRNNKDSVFITKFEGLDHADQLGLILISNRARILINWLVNALLSLKHPHSGNGLQLIRIYGPKVKLDRGPALAFNVYDWKGEKVEPFLVQKLADRNNISVGCGFLKNIWFSKEMQVEKELVLEEKRSLLGLKEKNKKKGKSSNGIEVVSIYVGMLSDFEDVFRVWKFVSRFLDADFVEKERWRYVALNRTSVEV